MGNTCVTYGTEGSDERELIPSHAGAVAMAEDSVMPQGH